MQRMVLSPFLSKNHKKVAKTRLIRISRHATHGSIALFVKKSQKGRQNEEGEVNDKIIK